MMVSEEYFNKLKNEIENLELIIKKTKERLKEQKEIWGNCPNQFKMLAQGIEWSLEEIERIEDEVWGWD